MAGLEGTEGGAEVRETAILPTSEPPALGPAGRWSKLAGRFPALTVLGRSVFLMLGEVLVNALLWVVAVLLFAVRDDRKDILSLCLIAWTLGLRHGLDMDHIIAIDNVTRNLVSMGKLPVTCGLWFSLGHSTIVLGATIAIVASANAVAKLPDVAAVGGIVGVCVSASFLFILALINTAVLVINLRKRKEFRQQQKAQPVLEAQQSIEGVDKQKLDPFAQTGLPAVGCLSRIARPIFKLIDAPWKLYPVGVLFGFGFDTASEIVLLGLTSIAGTSTDDREALPTAQILVLPLLFAAGMTAVDSLDSVFMLHAYSMPAQEEFSAVTDDSQSKLPWYKRFKLFRPRRESESGSDKNLLYEDEEGRLRNFQPGQILTVSIILTSISIALAFFISLVQFMGLAAEECASCADAAENDPGLSGRWWRFWIAVNDNSGYLGAGIIGVFIVVFGGWGILRLIKRRRARRACA